MYDTKTNALEIKEALISVVLESIAIAANDFVAQKYSIAFQNVKSF
jgi:hypothetical protein